MDKPIVFLSHIHEDKNIANTLENIISDVLLGGIDFFNSSNRKSISPGDPWRDLIIEKIGKSKALLVLLSPESVSRPWINFESGGAWISGKKVIPCCVSGMIPTSLPPPLSHLQAIDLSKTEGFDQLLEFLAECSGLNKPNVNSNELVNQLKLSWETEETISEDTKSFSRWVKNTKLRPKKLAGEKSSGIAHISEWIHSVEPFEARQFRGKGIVAGDSIRVSINKFDPNSYDYISYCFTNTEIADNIIDWDLKKDEKVKVTLECLGLLKIREQIYNPLLESEDDEEKYSYEPAYLIENIERL